ncbi:uncharacterized protein LOC113667541 [Pocillopora damicornis]|uniref:uncharacterized protein LOC113667541 n=2 Tax=Pocillopora TaxID=46730 RepID=UPI000F553AB4|nr:uncharacterized protein LOC113667541 [Pocillopora damicornis]
MSSHHSNSEKGSGKNEVSDDKSRSRSSSIGKFLMKKRQKQKERAPVPHFPPSSTSAGSQSVMMYRRTSDTQPFQTTVLQSSFRRILSSSLETRHRVRPYNYTI